jgi:glycosyltransferase involved in cell wall biosynthesis
MRIAIVRYDHVPLHVKGRRSGFRTFLQGVPLNRITPAVRYDVPGKDPRGLYVPLPVDSPEVATSRTYRPDGVLRILCVAKLAQPRKSHFLLIESLKQLPPEKYMITFVGSTTLDASDASQAYLDQLREIANASDGRTRIFEDQSYDRMQDIFLSHDVVVLPASREPHGIAPLEGMGCGCVPVMSADCGSAGTIPKDACFIFAMGDSQHLAMIMRELIELPSLCEEVGRRALAFAREELCPARAAECLEGLAAGHRRGDR